MSPARKLVHAWLWGLSCALGVSGCVSVPAFHPQTSRPRPAVLVEKNAQGEWVLRVEEQPFLVRGVWYRPTPVGQSPDAGYEWTDWTLQDSNGNGKADGPYEAWPDYHRNNAQEFDEPACGDFQLMRDMGVNTLLWYHNATWRDVPRHADLDVLRDAYLTYGLRIAVGDYLGAYGIAAEPGPNAPTDYTSPRQQERMLRSVETMVRTHRNEPYVLCWVLGVGNNWSDAGTNALQHPEAYVQFVNRAATRIRELDGRHPIVLATAELGMLNLYRTWAPAVDVLGVVSYEDVELKHLTWEGIRQQDDRPVLILGYAGEQEHGADEDAQALIHRLRWQTIVREAAGGTGSGLSIGGIVGDWLDQWWTAGDPYAHARVGSTSRRGARTMFWEHEYQGICSQGDGHRSPFLRQLRKVYNVYRDELWTRARQ